MANISKTHNISRPRIISGKLTMLLLMLLTICVCCRPAIAETSIYVFDPNQSTVFRSGGIAGLQKTFSIAGRFRLTIDSVSSVASFEIVDANLTDEAGSVYGQSLDEIFNMTGLAGIVVGDTTINFEGKTADGTESDVRLKLSFIDDSAHLTGKTTPPPNSADMFFYDVNAVAIRKYAGGTGEPNNPYQITTAEDLINLGETTEDYDKHFILTADIDLDPNLPGRKIFYRAVIAPAKNRGWNPSFSGIFDGGNYEISGLVCSSPNTGSDYVGLFGQNDGQLINLILRIPNIDAEVTIHSLTNDGQPEYGQDIGGLVGLLKGSISNCHISGGKIRGNAYVGGLVGSIVGNGEVIGCTSSASIRGNRGVGGLAGVNSGKVYECFSSGTVEGTPHPIFVGRPDPSYDVIVGGLVGINKGTILNCHSNADVKGHGLRSDGWAVPPLPLHAFGGLTGLNTGTIAASCAVGKVSGLILTDGVALGHVGGLIGMNEAIVSDCYSTGNVESGGGLVGDCESGVINKCYSISKVSGNGGGLVKYSTQWSTVQASFWNSETSEQSTSSGGTHKTTDEMQDPNTFMAVGWDFIGQDDSPHDIWAVDTEGEYQYPILCWQLLTLPTLPFSNGNGESNDPYLISTADELNSIGHNPRLMPAHFRLVNNIDLAGINFYIIGSKVYPFTGIFDGDGHTISNFSYNSADSHGIGLFRYVQGRYAAIKNVSLINPNVDAGLGDDAGSLVGNLDGIISNCHVEGGCVWGNNNVGGLVGSGGTISDCSSSVTVDGNEPVGGLVGSGKDITDCTSSASVSGNNFVGGLVGKNLANEMTTISNSCATGRVVGYGIAGGLLGGAIDYDSIGTTYAGLILDSPCIISGCYSIADVNVTLGSSVGGLVGHITFTTIINCYAKGTVLCNSSSGPVATIGGLVGSKQDSTITNCYASGKVSGGSSIRNLYSGGLVGTVDKSISFKGIVTDSFWDTQTTNQADGVGFDGGDSTINIFGLITEDMMQQATFTNEGWDFVDEMDNGTEYIWWILEGQDYPRLWWETNNN